MKEQVKSNPNRKLFLVSPIPAPVKDATEIEDARKIMRHIQENGKKSIELIGTFHQI